MIFEKSDDTKILTEHLSGAQVGEIVPYAELSRVVGKSLSGFRSALASARRQVLKEKGFVFGTEKGVGIRRLSNEEIIAASTSDRHAIRRKARRSLQKLGTVEYAALDATKQIALTAVAAVFHATAEMNRDSSMKLIQAAAGSSQQLPIRETLQALARGIGE
jgi:hypothetical protein